MSERFPARRSRGGDAAAPVAGVLLVLALATLALGASRDPGLGTLILASGAAVLGLAGALLLIWAIGYRRLSYVLTDSSLRVEWLGGTLAIPYPAIQGIYTGQRLAGHASPSVPCWPGISVGPARVRGVGRTRFFATSVDQSLLTLITVEHGGLVLSARDPNEFRAALIEHVEQYADVSGEDVHTWYERRPTQVPWTAFADRWLLACVVLGTVGLLLVLASIGLSYDSLPEQVPLHFDVSGQTSQIAPKSDLMRLPLLGLVCLIVNWLLGVTIHARDRLLARLLWLGGVVVQPVLLVGVLRLLA
ncbi:MAG TPA: PH domain-containing protein [Chloroflexota bacterium]